MARRPSPAWVAHEQRVFLAIQDNKSASSPARLRCCRWPQRRRSRTRSAPATGLARSPRSPPPLDDYRLHELTRERKAFSTIEDHRLLFKRYIEPRWGSRRLGAVRTMEVEEWLHSLPLAPSSKAKLKCVLSTLYHHASIRYEWADVQSAFSRVRT